MATSEEIIEIKESIVIENSNTEKVSFQINY